MPSTSQILIAANPKSGASSRAVLVEQLREQLQNRQFDVTICQQLSQVETLSHQLSTAGTLHSVIAAGGDGTAAAVVNLIPLGTQLGIFPLGTENLLAKYLGLTNEPSRAAETIAAGQTIKLDAGLAAGRLFLVMLGCGFDAEVVAQMHQLRSGHINRLSYAKPIWRAIRNYSYPAIDIECLDASSTSETTTHTQRFSAAWLFAFNLPRYAANLNFCPQADGKDGQLDLCTFRRGGFWTSTGYLWRLWRGTHQQMTDFQHVRCRRFRLTSVGRVPYQIDGDPGGHLPLEIEVLPERLNILVPSSSNSSPN